MDARSAVETAGIRPPREWRIGKHYLPCPECRRGPHDDRLTLWVRDDGHANWVCNRCGWQGNTWTCNRCGKPQRACRCEEFYWNPKREPAGPRRFSTEKKHEQPQAQVEPTPTVGEGRETIPYTAEHEDFWQRCREIEPDDPVGRYLQGRCCALPSPMADLRWRPNWTHWKEHHVGPCMVGRITNMVSGEPQSFHFTWVRPDGSGKAPLRKARLLARGMAKKDGVIRLSEAEGDPNGCAVIGEGIETVLSAVMLAPHRFGLAAIDAGNLADLSVPRWLYDVVVLIDHDKVNERTGLRPGLAAADNYLRRAAQVVADYHWVYPPHEGWDFNDLACHDIEQARRQMVA